MDVTVQQFHVPTQRYLHKTCGWCRQRASICLAISNTSKPLFVLLFRWWWPSSLLSSPSISSPFFCVCVFGAQDEFFSLVKMVIWWALCLSLSLFSLVKKIIYTRHDSIATNPHFIVFWQQHQPFHQIFFKRHF